MHTVAWHSNINISPSRDEWAERHRACYIYERVDTVDWHIHAKPVTY